MLEQKRTGRLIRPSARYVGPAPRRPEDVPGWDPVMVAPAGTTPRLVSGRVAGPLALAGSLVLLAAHRCGQHRASLVRADQTTPRTGAWLSRD